jgi:hypothetical protein
MWFLSLSPPPAPCQNRQVPELASAKQRVQELVCNFVHEGVGFVWELLYWWFEDGSLMPFAELMPLLDESMQNLTCDLVIDDERFRGVMWLCSVFGSYSHLHMPIQA